MSDSIEISMPNMLVISACPADVHLCLGVIRRDSPSFKIVVLITWASIEVQTQVINCLLENGEIENVLFISDVEAYEIAQDRKWAAIYLFTMGAAWLGRILFERKDVLRYRDCYLDYEQLSIRDIDWNHLAIIKFHGLKYWLKTQVLRATLFVKYSSSNLGFRPDMHVWPRTDSIKEVWDHEKIPDVDLDLTELPNNAIIFCFSSIDNGWAPDWSIFKKTADKFFCKIHPRTGRVDYLGYPDWVVPLDGYDLPMELYQCPDNSLIVGTTSTALGGTQNSISLWNIKLLDWKKNHSAFEDSEKLFTKSPVDNLNCRSDLYHL